MKMLLLHKGTLSEYTFSKLYFENFKPYIGNKLSQFDKAILPYAVKQKTVPVKESREWIERCSSVFNTYDLILISDSKFFQSFTKLNKAASTLGTIVDSPYVDAKIMYVPSHWAFNSNTDKVLEQLELVSFQLKNYVEGTYSPIGSNIIKTAKTYFTVDEIRDAVNQLHNHAQLAVDIEAFSLRVTDAGIGTISFAWNKHEGMGFPVDIQPDTATEVRQILREFFETYQGKLIYHKANYDACVLIYELFMDSDITNLTGLFTGLNYLVKNYDDTLIISYLATNTCAGNSLGLKDLAYEFAGDWAVEVKDITKVDINELLRYNIIDCLSTMFVYEKYTALMISEEQDELYHSFMKPTLTKIIRMQLHGLPIDLDEVANLKQTLINEKQALEDALYATPEVKNAEWFNAEAKSEVYNSKHKKQKEPQDFIEPLNFGSGQQLAVLLHDVMNLSIVDTTKTGLPATGKDTLVKLANLTSNQHHKDILNSIVEHIDVTKILSTFIPAFENAHVDKHGNAHLLGFFNLGGTVSGRLSSSNVNLQQLPSSGSRFAKPVKKCFKAPEGWIFCGIDFDSLEDKISALTTKDPNKLKVYTDGFDGHCLRAYYYFSDKMSDIDPTSVESINSIASKYKALRQNSKAPTFALTYQGTYLTLMKNCGFSEELARSIEANYHEMYKVSDDYIQYKIAEACTTGYVITGFGLKVRTPVLQNTIYSKDSMPPQAQAEARTAGNALGQGWGVLNDRARNATIDRIDEAGLSYDILPVATIHDANYYLIKDDAEILAWLNQVVTEEASWQDHPDITHDEVHLSGKLDVFFPSWADAITLKNPKASANEVLTTCLDAINQN